MEVFSFMGLVFACVKALSNAFLLQGRIEDFKSLQITSSNFVVVEYIASPLIVLVVIYILKPFIDKFKVVVQKLIPGKGQQIGTES